MITQEIVKQLFNYKDGKLFWAYSPCQSVEKGDEAGWTDAMYYRNVMINSKTYKTHRLVFLYHKGYLPEYLDHIDGDPSNNNIDNLREATLSQNQQNAKTRKDNTSGIKGVGWHKAVGKWQGRLYSKGIRISVGFFDNIEDAANELCLKRIELHGEFCNHGKHLKNKPRRG